MTAGLLFLSNCVTASLGDSPVLYMLSNSAVLDDGVLVVLFIGRLSVSSCCSVRASSVRSGWMSVMSVSMLDGVTMIRGMGGVGGDTGDVKGDGGWDDDDEFGDSGDEHERDPKIR